MSQNKRFDEEPDGQGSSRILRLLEMNPKKTFILMVTILVVSVIGTVLYSVLKKPYVREPLQLDTSIPMDNMTHGLGKIMSGGTAVSEALKLEKEIDHLLKKDKLTDTDSLALLDALQRLESIQQKLNPIKK